MPADPREEMALALAEQSPDDDELRDWLTDRAEFVIDALAAAGFHLCTEGQAVVDREVVGLELRWVTGCSEGLRYAAVPLTEEAPDAR